MITSWKWQEIRHFSDRNMQVCISSVRNLQYGTKDKWLHLFVVLDCTWSNARINYIKINVCTGNVINLSCYVHTASGFKTKRRSTVWYIISLYLEYGYLLLQLCTLPCLHHTASVGHLPASNYLIPRISPLQFLASQIHWRQQVALDL